MFYVIIYKMQSLFYVYLLLNIFLNFYKQENIIVKQGLCLVHLSGTMLIRVTELYLYLNKTEVCKLHT